jgi:phospholipid transport system substrate-binding protein
MARAFAFLFALFAVLGGGRAEAQAAERYLKTKHDAAVRVLRGAAENDAARARRDEQITRMLSDLLDYDELSRRALATHWDGLGEPQRREFADLLKQLVERSYQGNLERTLNYEVRYMGEAPTEGGVVVRTVARSRENRRAPEVEIAYSMHEVAERWRVFDIETDGVSLVDNYRRQFHRIITRDGFDGLLRSMRQRLEQGSDL